MSSARPGGREGSFVRLTALENGCLFLEAEGAHAVRRHGAERTVERLRIALCRCGSSGSKPYCDATHSAVGFVAARAELEPVVCEERTDA